MVFGGSVELRGVVLGTEFLEVCDDLRIDQILSSSLSTAEGFEDFEGGLG